MASSVRQKKSQTIKGAHRISLGSTQQTGSVYGHRHHLRGVEFTEYVEASAVGRRTGHERFPGDKR